jgi:hypothetical protein
MNDGYQIQAGGEVYSVSKWNDMGISSFLSLKWMDQGNLWHYWDGWVFGGIDAPYEIGGIAPDGNNNVQVLGNNGTPIPPTAPCK